jgi:hypothetical protein
MVTNGHSIPELDDILALRDNANDAYKFLFDHILPQVVGKTKWNKLTPHKLVSKVATPGDEAFAIVVLENSLHVWLTTANTGNKKNGTNDGDKENKPIPTRYTLSGSGTRKNRGWSDDGYLRFHELVRMIKEDRTREGGSKFEKKYMDQKLEELNQRTGNKKQRVGENKARERLVPCVIDDPLSDDEDAKHDNHGQYNRNDNGDHRGIRSSLPNRTFDEHEVGQTDVV